MIIKDEQIIRKVMWELAHNYVFLKTANWAEVPHTLEWDLAYACGRFEQLSMLLGTFPDLYIELPLFKK